MIYATIADYRVGVAPTTPRMADWYVEHAALVERFDTDEADAEEFYLTVKSNEDDWPFLYVAQRYYPNHWAGCYPGILLVPETHILFVGAGGRLLAYDLKGRARLWEDRADWGFHSWQRHDDMILMSAELEFAAWDSRGTKRWSTIVEPPWEYRVEGGTVHLNVMDVHSSFPLRTGPTGA